MGRSILDAATFEPGRTVTTLILSLALLATIATPALAGPFEEAKAIVSDAKKLATRAAEAEKKFQAAAKGDEKKRGDKVQFTISIPLGVEDDEEAEG